MNTSEQRKRSAAITGAGGGLGRDIALGLAAKAYGVFGTAIWLPRLTEMNGRST
jgi:NAD(P)-dependent dehydrogenase (short-subunit alcohol dehydrogenase family)